MTQPYESKDVPTKEQKANRADEQLPSLESQEGLMHSCLEGALNDIHDPTLTPDWERLVRMFVAPETLALDELAKQMTHMRYRHLSSFGATISFIRALGRIHRKGTAEMCEELDLPSLHDIWEARQNADFLGVEYDDYINAIGRLHGEDGPRDFTTNMLCGTLALVLAYRQLRTPHSSMPLPAGVDHAIGID